MESTAARTSVFSTIRSRFFSLPCVLALVVTGVIAAGSAEASQRRFTFSYEANPSQPGEIEYEQWVTWKTHKDEDPRYDRIDFRHELEFGVTDRLTLAVYLSDWRYEDGRSVEDDGVDWRSVAVEGVYNLLNPTVDPIGLSIYGEAKIGDELLELETKLLLQKNIGQWVFVWNGTLEAEWEGSNYGEDNGVLAQTVGVSYELTPKFLLGAELLHEVEIGDWEKFGDHVVYIGPNFSYRASRWWVTVTPLFQATDHGGEADFQTRLIFGIEF